MLFTSACLCHQAAKFSTGLSATMPCGWQKIMAVCYHFDDLSLGLDRYRASARYPIPDTIGRSYTDTDTGLYKFFVLKVQFCAEYRCVQVMYVCGVYARKYGRGLKL